MQTIDPAQAQKMLDADPEDTRIHACVLGNGRFFYLYVKMKL